MTAPLTLYENVPLVSAAKLGTFFDTDMIGHHYGDLTRSRVRCAKLEPTLYLAGAHPWQKVVACYIQGKKTDGFIAKVRTDKDGVTRQYIELTAPPAEDNSVIEIAGKGKQSLITGRLLENPDEIIADIGALAGRTLNFPLFREACNRKGLRIAGSVYEERSIRSYVNEIIESVGAKWLADSAVLTPGEELEYALPLHEFFGITQEIDLDAVAGKMGVYYGWNHAAGRYGNYIELEAIGCQYDNKGIFNARWLRLARDAEALGRKLLGKRAGEFIKVNATVPGIIRAGQVVEVSGARYNGPMLVTTASPSDVATVITGDITLSTFPNMKVTQFSNENQTLRSERVDVLLDLVKREATITIFDAQNRPMPDVLVTYDGSVTKKTDRIGSVVISISSGSHTLILQGKGIDSSEPYPLFIP